jgi:acyl dehydratase
VDERWAVGHRPPVRRFGPLTRTDIVRYQGASGDFNPMHHDDEMARAAGYPGAFSVGMLAGGWMAAHCTELYGERNVREFSVRFHSIVYPGAVLEASVEVIGRTECAGEDRVELRLSLVDVGPEPVLVASGDAVFMIEQHEEDS